VGYHIVLNRPMDLNSITASAKDGLNPRNSMAELRDRLGAKVHDGSGLVPSTLDRLLARALRMSPLWWAIARKVQREVKPGDVIFCTGEDIGFPIAFLCGGRRNVHVTMMAHRVDNQKKRVALRLFGLKRRVSTFFTVSKPQEAFLKRFLNLGADRVSFIWDQTDTHFFRDGPSSPEKKRPLVMSVGLERRDYSTLAAATADLPLDVRISGYSADTRVLSNAFPDPLPTNMERRFYSWKELLQLYRDADVVVVSLFPNTYAAGVQGFMEAMSCGRPVIVTATAGLAGYLEPADTLELVQPGDAAGLRDAISRVLSNPEKSRQDAKRNLALAGERHTCERYVDAIAITMRRLAGASPDNDLTKPNSDEMNRGTLPASA